MPSTGEVLFHEKFQPYDGLTFKLDSSICSHCIYTLVETQHGLSSAQPMLKFKHRLKFLYKGKNVSTWGVLKSE